MAAWRSSSMRSCNHEVPRLVASYFEFKLLREIGFANSVGNSRRELTIRRSIANSKNVSSPDAFGGQTPLELLQGGSFSDRLRIQLDQAIPRRARERAFDRRYGASDQVTQNVTIGRHVLRVLVEL